MAVRLRNDLKHWILFFLNGVEETAKKRLSGFPSNFGVATRNACRCYEFGQAGRNRKQPVETALYTTDTDRTKRRKQLGRIVINCQFTVKRI